MQKISYKRNCPTCNKELSYKSSISFKFAEKNNQKCISCCDRKNSLSQEVVIQILELNSRGVLNREIARTLNLNHRTIAYYLKKHGKESNFANQPIDMVSDDTARCRKCSEIKSINEFQWGRKGQKYEYKFSYCNRCRKQQVYLNLNSALDKFLKDKHQRLVNRCKKLNIVCSISYDDFVLQYHSQNGKCFYTDEEMVCKVGYGKHRNSLSIDKIIPEKGYIKGNFVFSINRINTCKNDLSLEDLKRWMPEFFYRIKINELSEIIRADGINLSFSWDNSTADEHCLDRGGYYSQETNTIQVSAFDLLRFKDYKDDKIKPASKVFYTMCHEYGHALIAKKTPMSAELLYAYKSRELDNPMVINEEREAWMKGAVVARKLDAHDEDLFWFYAKSAINTYKSHPYPEVNDMKKSDMLEKWWPGSTKPLQDLGYDPDWTLNVSLSNLEDVVKEFYPRLEKAIEITGRESVLKHITDEVGLNFPYDRTFHDLQPTFVYLDPNKGRVKLELCGTYPSTRKWVECD